MKIKLYRSRANHGATMMFRMKPQANPDLVEQSFLMGRGEFGPAYAMAFDKHLKRLKDWGWSEGLWFGKGEACYV